MNDPIIAAMFKELGRAREKYPDDQWPWFCVLLRWNDLMATANSAGAWSILEMATAYRLLRKLEYED